MASPGDTVYPTLTQLRAVGTYVQVAGLVGGMNYRDPDDQYDLVNSASVSLSITAPSAREQCLVDTDLSVEQRVPGVDNTTCAWYQTDGVTPIRVDYDMLNFAHNPSVMIYGPHPAMTHADWTGDGPGGGGPCGDADEDGNFTVAVGSGTATLTLTLACGYEERLNLVHFQTAPDGAPFVYWYRKADTYYPAQWPNPEAVWCWLGYAWMSFALTAPAADTLTLTIRSKRYYPYIVDNHLTDSTRQTEFGWSATSHEHTYSFAVDAGIQQVNTNLIAPRENEHPILERVTEIELSGMQPGSWIIGEPRLHPREGVNGHVTVKTFEGYEYQKGGFSCHVDAAFEYGAGDSDHANKQEWTVPFFDYLEGAVTGLDLTTAFSLATMAALIQGTSDAFTCSVNTAAFEAATHDDEDPHNELSMWGFDICWPGCTAGSSPLEQNGDENYLNCSIRVGTWTIVAGLVYAIRTDKVVHGRGHGRAAKPSGKLVESTNKVGYLWRRCVAADAAWEYIDQLDSDQHGHWTSISLPEFHSYDGTTPRRWEYGIGRSATLSTQIYTTNLSAYTREWLAANVRAKLPGGHGMFFFQWGLRPAVVWIEGTDIRLSWMRDDTTWETPVVVDSTGEYDSVSATTNGSRIWVTARNSSTEALYWFYHDAMGDTDVMAWEGPTLVA